MMVRPIGRWLFGAAGAAFLAACAAPTTTEFDHGAREDGGEADGERDGEPGDGTEVDVPAEADATAPACTDPADCDGGPCVDGYCCDTACTGTCEACDVPGREGTCAPIPYNEDPDEECLAELPAACGFIGFCNGARACAMYGEETSCDDGDPCTAEDACTRTGSCRGTTAAACEPGPADQCCDGACDSASGCYTTAGSCVEACEANRLIVGQTCVGCGAAGAEGICTGGATYACDSSLHTPCQEVTCGGTTRRCTRVDGVWAWRTGVACDDGNPCTFNDACFGGSCSGTTYTCVGDDCMSRTCDGTGLCDETPAGSGDACGTVACRTDECTGLTWHDYPAACTSTCDGSGTCDLCSCSPTDRVCTVGPTNVCCAAACSDTGGCYAVPGSCGGGDVCSSSTVLTVGSACSGCGPAGANGTCGGGGTFTCNATTHVDCQNVSCGGTSYWCTRVGGVWQWRTSDSCDDGSPCTWGDSCGASGCAGTPISCPSTDCATRSCSGTSSCAETFRPAGTSCGTTACAADSCASGAFHDLPGSCSSVCDGAGTCPPCSCTETVTACTVGPTNQCCAAACDAAVGCSTTAGACADLCSDPNTLTTGRGCSGCSGNGANGTCLGGTTWDCRAGSYIPCQSVICGGTTYYCTNQGGSVRWRSSDSRCDDADLCTYNDVCTGTTCAGATLRCDPTPPCISRACNGTPTCAVTYNTGVACDDGSACTTGETCNASGSCTGGSSTAVCGDTVCNCGETAATCPGDCGTPCPSSLSLATWDSGADGWTWDGLWRRSGGALVAGSTTSYCSSYTQNLTYGTDVDLSGCTTGATLRFQVRLVDDSTWSPDVDRSERLFVECWNNSPPGAWVSLVPSPWPTNQSPCSTSYCDGGEGLDRSFAWTSQAITLPSSCRNSQARFRFRATGSCVWRLMNPGWYVDTVSLN